MVNRKKFRYLYWTISAFFRKNFMIMLVSFLAGIIGIISIISLSPYFLQLITKQKVIVGIAGRYAITSELPEQILAKITNSLVYVNDTGEIIPLLAESWESTKNGKEYRFYLKKNLTWGDGKDFTAADLQYDFPDVKLSSPDKYIAVFKLNKEVPTFPTYLTKYVTKYPLQGVAGLYSVQRVKTKFGNYEEIHLTPNRPNNPIYIYKFYDNETQLINAYKLGEITEFSTSKESIAKPFESWKNTSITKNTDYTQVLTLFFNQSNPLLAEKEVRKAISQSIPKSLITENGEKALGPIPPTSWAYNKEMKQTPYNPDVAKKIMEKYTGGTESAKLKLATFYDFLSNADTVKKSLAELGLDVQVQVDSLSNSRDNFDMLLAYWSYPQDPDQYFYWHSTQSKPGGGNFVNYKNVRVDKLLEDGRSTLNIKERTAKYDQFQKVMADDLPAYFLYYPNVYTVTRR